MGNGKQIILNKHYLLPNCLQSVPITGRSNGRNIATICFCNKSGKWQKHPISFSFLSCSLWNDSVIYFFFIQTWSIKYRKIFILWVGWRWKNLVNLNRILRFRYLDIKSILLWWNFWSKNCIFRRLVGLRARARWRTMITM